MHYVATQLAEHMNEQYHGTKTIALDGNFPFIDRFPLLPHLSHHDGKKLDFAFFYKDENGHFLNGKTRSPIGYWAFERPVSEPCDTTKQKLTMRWDMNWFQPIVNNLVLEDNRMRTALKWLNTSGKDLGLRKMFIEPHLAKRYGIQGGILKFQGCRAARHDDHIHIQF
ncbi:hypothetical protein RYZ26_17510 [Terasakiella sp. A23]|uniref:hypothetical protein n=1 Tax=Terasakiella sp. FCG-A23 TaxID=3080561 RepID=UPI002952A07C|nr:hypothetical protein [Terasakiella sp. A23]MDV7341410.1 hypothetical protein [Terasakiella sp. A23]